MKTPKIEQKSVVGGKMVKKLDPKAVSNNPKNTEDLWYSANTDFVYFKEL